MKQSEGLKVLSDAFQRVYGRAPSRAELLAAGAGTMLETTFGRGQQFLKLANAGMFNYGAEQKGRPPCGPGFSAGSDVGQVCFYVFSNDDDAADHMLQILKKTGIPLDQGPVAQSSAMRRSGYYGGRNWAPGYNEAYNQAHPDSAVAWSTREEADAANVQEYASAIAAKTAVLAGADKELGGPGVTRAGSGASFFSSIGSARRQWAIGGAITLALGGVAYVLARRGDLGREPAKVAGNLAHALRNVKAMVL